MASFMDRVRKDREKLSQGNNNEGKKYPELKHKALYLNKDNPQVAVQILPFKDKSGIALQTRKLINLEYTNTNNESKKTTVVLEPEPNPASDLENKLAEWKENMMLPSQYGQQTPVTSYLVNVVRVYRDKESKKWKQELDEEGKPVVRLMELRSTAYDSILANLEDPDLDPSDGESELSFLDPEKAYPIKITKPEKGEKAYKVTVVQKELPPLHNWEDQLEDLEARTESTESMNPDWARALINMKENRDPNAGKPSSKTSETTTTTNAYANDTGSKAEDFNIDDDDMDLDEDGDIDISSGSTSEDDYDEQVRKDVANDTDDEDVEGDGDIDDEELDKFLNDN